MPDSPYARFDGARLILRDELAPDRTALANGRTLLAYLRTGVTLLIAGVSIIHFALPGWFRAVGFACRLAGAAATVIGLLRYLKINRTIACLRARADARPPPESPAAV